MGHKNPTSNYYAILTADVRYDNDLSSSEKIFFAEITALSNKEGICWASNGYFADLYDVANSTVSSWVKSLKAKGYIHVDYVTSNNQITKRLIKPCGTGKTAFEAFDGIQLNEQGYSENPKGGVQKTEGGYSENPKGNTTSDNNTSKNNKSDQGKFFDETHPLVTHIEENYSRIAKMAEPLTSEEAAKIMKDYREEYPDLFATEKELKQEIDNVLQELNNHKATSKNISANLTFRKWFNNHIDWHLIPNKDTNGVTGKSRLLSIKQANALYTENIASTNGTGTPFDLVFDHIEGEGRNKKYRVNPQHTDKIDNWNING